MPETRGAATRAGRKAGKGERPFVTLLGGNAFLRLILNLGGDCLVSIGESMRRPDIMHSIIVDTHDESGSRGFETPMALLSSLA